MKHVAWENIDIQKIEMALNSSAARIVFGIDGYVDEVWEIVESRSSGSQYASYVQMKKFGELIVDCEKGGLSTEIIRKRRTYGGFTANTGNSAACLGVDTTMIGLYGTESIDPVFKEFENTCTVLSIGDPAISHIMEFEDGKLMLVYIKEIMEIGWDMLTGAVHPDKLNALFSGADIIALGYWSNMPAFDEFVNGIIANLPSSGRRQRLFLDLADIRKRDEASLHRTMALLSRINRKIPISLSLNEHEAALLFASFHVPFEHDVHTTQNFIQTLLNEIGLDEIIVHTPHFAAAANHTGELATVPQRFCEKPVRTTAAGDNFNGGYLAACAAGVSLREGLAMANASASFFLRNGYSADRTAIIKELETIKHEQDAER